MQESTLANTERLASLIDRKHDCLEQLRDLGDRQFHLIEGGQVTELLRILTSKHRLIAALQQIEHDLTPFRGEDPETRLWRSAEARSNCARKADACRELLDDVVRQEKSNEALMLQRRQTVADRLHHVHSAARASGAYRTHAFRSTQKQAPLADHAVETSKSASDRAGDRVGAGANGLDLSSDIR